MLVYSRLLIKLYLKMYILHKRDILQSITFFVSFVANEACTCL